MVLRNTETAVAQTLQDMLDQIIPTRLIAPKTDPCLGKNRFETWWDANEVAVAYMRRIALTFGVMSAYSCKQCELWHIGHAGKRKQILDALTRCATKRALRDAHTRTQAPDRTREDGRRVRAI